MRSEEKFGGIVKIKWADRNYSDLFLGTIYGAIGLIGMSIALFFPQILHIIPPCKFYLWTGIPCPSCGATRSGIFLTHLDGKSALVANPFFFLVYLALFFWGINTIWGLIFKKNLSLKMTTREQSKLKYSILMIIGASWIFTITWE